MMSLGGRLTDDRSLGQLLKDLSTETVTLLRQEIDLAKAEVQEKVAHVGTMTRGAAIGGALAFGGGLALLAALIFGLMSVLVKFMSPWLAMWVAPLIVGLVFVGVGYAMIRSALARHQSLMPRKTAASLQENKEWLKSRIR